MINKIWNSDFSIRVRGRNVMNLAHRLLYVLITLADKYIFLNYYCMANKCIYLYIFVDFPGGWIPESARSPKGGNGTHSSVLAWEILWPEGARWGTVHGVPVSQT